MPNTSLPFINNATTEYADALPREQFIDYNIKALWQGMPRIAGSAFTVQLTAGDNLMLHSAIYEAPAGSILVVDADSDSYAVAGGNVCAIAQKRGIAGMIIDGVIRDLAEIRSAKFPVYARGHVAKPGVKKFIAPLNQPILCGSVKVNPNDIIVADEEGIAVIPHSQQQEAFDIASKRTALDKATSLDDWEKAHRAKVLKLLSK
ncbi:MAG: RraA family protein [Cocleimonas sp.]